MSAAFSPDGARVVTASKDKTARLWDAATGKEVAVLRGHDDAVMSAALSPAGGASRGSSVRNTLEWRTEGRPRPEKPLCRRLARGVAMESGFGREVCYAAVNLIARLIPSEKPAA